METYKLYGYQLETVKKLKDLDRSICALDMGLGKSYIALALAEIWNPKRLVIICPKIKMRKINNNDDSWENYVRRYLDDDFYIPKRPSITQEYINTSKIIVLNYDMFKKFKWHVNIRNTIFIFDEIQKAKNYKSEIGKKVFYDTLRAERVLCLSGDPYPQGYKDAFNLMRILTKEKLKFSWFKSYFMLFSHNGYFPIFEGYKNTDKLVALMNTYGVWMKTEEVLDLPEKVFVDIYFESNKQFNQLLTTKVLDLDEKNRIGGMIPIVILTYLRELSSGFIKSDTWDDDMNYIPYHEYKTGKLDKLKDLFESTSDNLIVFHNYVHESEMIKTFLLNSKVIEKENIYEINGSKNQKQEFLDSKNKSIVLCQYQAASAAIDGLQNKSSHLVCYSPTLSGENWKQMIKRIHRIGQTETCYYYLFQNELETSIYQNLKKLESYTEQSFLNYLKEKANEN